MNRHLLAGAVILACLCFITVAYACVEIDVRIWDYQKYVGVSNGSKTVSVMAEVEYGGPATEWDWTWPSGLECDEYDIEENEYDSIAEFWSDTQGVYRVWAYAENASNNDDSDWADVYVVEVSLDQVDGTFVGLNDDDDNENSTPDKDDSGPVSGENDLVQVEISLEPSELWNGTVELWVSGGIKVYYDSVKEYEVSLPASWSVARSQVPSSVWVEGTSVSSSIDDTSLNISYSHYGPTLDEYTADFTVVKADIDIDTNNNGSIESSEDPIEDKTPGAILPKNLEGDGEDEDFRKEIQLSVEPVLPDSEVILDLEADYGVVLWTASTGGIMKLLPKTYSPTELPSSMWVDGTVAGSKPYIRLRYKDSQGNTVAQDKVKVLVTETVSRSPQENEGCIWHSFSFTDSSDASAFENQMEIQGYDITTCSDDSEDDDNFNGCTLSDYKELFDDYGAIHVISHGEPGTHLSVYASSLGACNDWIDEEEDMVAAWHQAEGCYAVFVKSSWLSANSNLDVNDAIAHWAICFSATGGSGGAAVKEAAGGRWRIGYKCVTAGDEEDPIDPTAVTDKFLERMNGTGDGGQLRTAGEAWDDGDGYPIHQCIDYTVYCHFGGVINLPCDNDEEGINVQMDGKDWTTLCPAPMYDNPVWPDSDPGQRLGWGCIIFDTYIDDSLSATSALVCDSGGPISNQSWCGDTGYDKFILGFNYDNTGGGGAEIRADATFCKDEGEKQMDANRIAPNEDDPEGDDKEWEY